MNGNQWARLLAYVTGLVNQELLLQNEYLAAENRILRAHLPARLPLSDPERCTLVEIGRRLGCQANETTRVRATFSSSLLQTYGSVQEHDRSLSRPTRRLVKVLLSSRLIL